MRQLRYDDVVYLLSVARSCVDLKMKKFSKALDDLEQVLHVEPENLKGLQLSRFQAPFGSYYNLCLIFL